MEYVKDFKWHKGIKASELLSSLGSVGFQATQLKKAGDVILRMINSGSKIFLTFTSNMVTSGLRGFFAQIAGKKIPGVIVTTVGGIEEDIMRANSEKFILGSFNSDDIELYEQGVNRVGNIFVKNQSYENFEDSMKKILLSLYKKKKTWPVSEMLRHIGLMLNDKNSFLYQAAKNNIPVFCPAITDGAFGFHLFMFKQAHKDFIVDVVDDFANILFSVTQDDKKGIIALGGGVSKHHAIFSALLNGGLDYAVYMTTAHHTSGSMSGATTDEAKSWGKIKYDSDAATVIGDVSITFPLVMSYVFDELEKGKRKK